MDENRRSRLGPRGSQDGGCQDGGQQQHRRSISRSQSRERSRTPGHRRPPSRNRSKTPRDRSQTPENRRRAERSRSNSLGRNTIRKERSVSSSSSRIGATNKGEQRDFNFTMGHPLQISLSEDANKMDHMLRVVTELAASQNLTNSSQTSLNELCKQMSVSSYKERASEAIRVAGLQVPDIQKLTPAPALCNPKGPSENKTVLFPVGDMIGSRIVDTWKAMAGLKLNDEWNPSWDFPPPNPTKPNKSIPKPTVNLTDYAFPPNEFLCARALKNESVFETKSSTTSLPVNRLEDWEAATSACLSMVNMIDIFSSSINQDMENVFSCLDSFKENTLPPELQNLLEQRPRLKADQESRARALQHLTSTMTWLLAETISVRRDHVLTNSKLSQSSKDVLRMQPFGGPFLFFGRADEMIRKDSERNTAAVMLKLNDQLFVKKSGPNSTTTKPATYTPTAQRGKGPANRPFRGRYKAPAKRGGFSQKNERSSLRTSDRENKDDPAKSK